MEDSYLKINYYGKRNREINEWIHLHLNSPSKEERLFYFEKLRGIADKNVDADEFDIYRQKLKSFDVAMVNILDEDYPSQLKEIYDPPLVLFHKGPLSKLNHMPCVAIVGSRKCTNYGRQVAYEFARRLAGAGIAVISGMAYGIDSSAHQGAIDGGGLTAAVMGTGLDRCYPSKNRTLHSALSEKGVVLTEFKLGTDPLPYNFPRRNRIISGLSKAVIVIEAGEKSGALITADFAMEQGKDVYAVPSGILGPCGKGSNQLIKQGAQCLTDIGEVIESLAVEPMRMAAEASPDMEMTETERTLHEIIKAESPIHIDRLLSLGGTSINQQKSAIMTLMLKGKIYMERGNNYCIKS